MSNIKIYFAGSIRGGRQDAELYRKIINYLSSKGHVFTEHIGDNDLDNKGEEKTDVNIFKRDIEWLNNSDVIVAEVTVPSLGVGYEIGIAEKLKKPVLCLYRKNKNKKLSAMIAGNNFINNAIYSDYNNAKIEIDNFFNNIK